MFEKKISPFSIGRKAGKTLTKVAVAQYVKMKLNADRSPAKQLALEEFIFQLSSLESTTETAIFDLFEAPLFPHVSLMRGLRNKPVSFIYGEHDWVVSTGAEVLVTAA